MLSRATPSLKESAFETDAARVLRGGRTAPSMGPYVRKRLGPANAGPTGAAYERLCAPPRALGPAVPATCPWCSTAMRRAARRVVVMEHVGGETLADVVYRCDPSLALACDVFPPALRRRSPSSTEAFDVPLIHRDLKPSNVMLTRDSLTLIDFGIARAYRRGGGARTPATSARGPMRRPSSSATGRPTRAPTSTRSGCCCTSA